MKANAGKRKIFDAVDLLTEDTSAQVTEVKSGNGVEQIKVDDIQAFHDHPFHLYEGERLQDMVQSIKEHGVLNPVIVRKLDKGYEMLSGHNRANAAKHADLAEIPAIVKENLSDEDAYVYVIETNLMQRSFNDFISDKSMSSALQFIQHDITKQRTKRTTLWHTDLCTFKHSFCDYSRIQIFVYQRYNSAISF